MDNALTTPTFTKMNNSAGRYLNDLALIAGISRPP